jgi:DNA-binding NarL/FixJ family response regulator
MKRTVVVISKDPKVHSALKTLRTPSLRLLEAPTGLGALFLCASQPVDSLVIDLDTPGMDWPRLTEKLAQTIPALPVVTLAAGEDEGGLAQRLQTALESSATRKQPASAHAALPMVRAQRA